MKSQKAALNVEHGKGRKDNYGTNDDEYASDSPTEDQIVKYFNCYKYLVNFS